MWWCAFIFRTVAYKDQHANKRTTARRRQESSMHHPERAVQHEHVFWVDRVSTCTYVEKNKKDFSKTLLYDCSFEGGLEIASG